MKRKDSVLAYVLIFAMVLMVFLCGVLFGNYIADQRLGDVRVLEDSLRTQAIGAEIQYELLLQEQCGYLNSEPLAKELSNAEAQVNKLENERGATDTDVLQLKNRYAILEIQHWLFTERARDHCNATDLPILYFYSNTNCPSCNEQGRILTTIRNSYQNVRVYSFDTNLSNPAVDQLKLKFNVKNTPAIVVLNVTYGFMSEEKLKSIVESN